MEILFWLIAGVTIISALMVVSLKNIFHCALFLILCLFSVAGIFVMLDAEFLAAAQVLIYVGAVSILIIFAIMLSENLASKKIVATNDHVILGFFVGLSFVLASTLIINYTILDKRLEKFFFPAGGHGTLPTDNILMIGKYLMTEFMLPFEVVSILLLGAMIGAIVLARKERS